MGRSPPWPSTAAAATATAAGRPLATGGGRQRVQRRWVQRRLATTLPPRLPPWLRRWRRHRQ